MSRTFTHQTAKRERVPMLVGLIGASGSGKTFSALRLATGMQRITGGEIFFIDTESRRALHYADQFRFQHLSMDAPFSPLDYLEAIRYCASKSASILIIDSMSHEHEGPGGVLEMHETELDRMAGQDFKKRDRMTFSAWAKPKAQRRRLINEVLRMGINGVFCFRAKEKIKITKGEDPIALGWQAIAGDEFVYEMTVNCLLYPGSVGHPVWTPAQAGENAMVKIPENLSKAFSGDQQITEATGESLARWASGDLESPEEPLTKRCNAMADRIRSASSLEALSEIGKEIAASEWNHSDRSALKVAYTDARSILADIKD